MLRQLGGLSRQQPLLMIFDDLHWIDPSSRELLDRVSERIAEWPVLLLAMFRPEFQPLWIGQPHVTMLMLPRLDRRDTVAMVANVAGNSVLSAEVMEEITERTDGVPLFVEELTKAVLEARAQAPAALSAISHPGPVPATLHASLMARLDRLGPPAKEIAQTGAAIGREFGYDLLAAAADLPEPQLREALDRLINAGLSFVRGTPPTSATSSSMRWCRMRPTAHCCAAGASGCIPASLRPSKIALRRSCWRNRRCWPSTARQPPWRKRR